MNGRCSLVCSGFTETKRVLCAVRVSMCWTSCLCFLMPSLSGFGGEQRSRRQVTDSQPFHRLVLSCPALPPPPPCLFFLLKKDGVWRFSCDCLFLSCARDGPHKRIQRCVSLRVCSVPIFPTPFAPCIGAASASCTSWPQPRSSTTINTMHSNG